ncbi:MAG: DUF3568 family protein [Syntrophales bacterium]
MKKTLSALFFIAAATLLLFGCDTSLTVGSKTVGIRSGSFLYEDGYLRTTYHAPFETVYAACEKTLAGLKATDIERIRKISHGNFMAMLMDEKIRINIDYLEKGMTAVSVMAGTAGNKIAAQLLHDRIAENLKTP